MHEPGADDVGCAEANRPPVAGGEVDPVEEGGALVALRVGDQVVREERGVRGDGERRDRTRLVGTESRVKSQPPEAA